MDHVTLLEYAEDELNSVIARLDQSEMDLVSNCPPWTVRRLASHALKNQLVWAGLVTDQQLMPVDEAMGAVPYEGDLAPIAAEVTALALQMWRSDGVMTTQHHTPLGVLPGAVVVDFALIDAAAHAWDLSASVGRAIQFAPESIPAMADVVALTCNEQAIELGLIKPPTEPPLDATETERLMAAAGRAIDRRRD
jgi:uncharacterized protein (TIGR03086 family)